MNGNISKQGIAADLRWMKRSGIGGAQAFDANLATPQVVDHRIIYMTPEWKDAFRYSAELADQLGLELAVAASPGWSETGGPWVPPADAMKKLTWSEVTMEGGRRFAGRLPAPPATTGPFGAVALDDPLARFEGKAHAPAPSYYADVAVLAYPVKGGSGPGPVPRVEGAAGAADAAALSDDSYETGVEVATGAPDRPGALVLGYPRAVTVRSATVFIPGVLPPFGDPAATPVLEAEGPNGWRRVADLPAGAVPTTVAFPPVTASRFRVVLGPYAGPKRPGLGAGAPGAAAAPFDFGGGARALRITELRLSDEARVHRYEAKAGFAVAGDYYALGGGGLDDAGAVPPGRVVDLTGRMRPDGALDWTPPPGRWRVVRLGASLTGATNHPATPEATGLEVDKFDGAAVRRYLDHYLAMYRDAAGPGMMGARGLRAIVTDSTEVGPSNWTPRMVERFRGLRGYDPTPWLPALTGAVVGSRAASDAFLYDWRRTLADLHASEHYRTVAEAAHAAGLTVYGEALEDQRPSLGDDMAMRRWADVPMAALWAYNRGDSPRPTLIGDMRGAASVAHLYGRTVVAAESLTSAMAPWAHSPADLRRVIDLEFANGVNRPVIHTSVHQPVDEAPGLSLAVFGQYFNRHETWAEMARPWVDYIARTGYLLQQGRFVADVAYFHGEEAPLTALYGQAPLADTPRAYGYDFVDADALLGELSVDGGEIASRGGARYRVLYLGGTSRRMTLPVLRRIAALAEAGATVVGDAPGGSPSLNEDGPEYRALVRRLWSGRPVTAVGRGRVVAGRDVEGALRGIGAEPDFSYGTRGSGGELLFVHRRLPDGDLYFVNNRRNAPERVEARFRVTGRAPEIWRADAGTGEPASYRIEGGATVVPLEMGAEESFFVVFRRPATAPALTVATPAPAVAATLDGPWRVAFQPGRGAPAAMTLPALGSLSARAEPRVRYFSGVAAYSRTFAAPAGWRPGTPLLVDLGAVGDVAEVRVNGRPAGVVWHAPYRLDVGPLVGRGRNRLEVRVADLWANRLIGDAQPGAAKVAFTTAPTYRPDAPLRPSGLIGPVRLMVKR